MITLQHTGLSFMVLSTKGNIQNFKAEIPWVLFPDAIRAYSGPRQPSHFENTPANTDTAWMEFPKAEVLMQLSKETFADKVKFYLPEGAFPKCAIGEDTNVSEFDAKNLGHPHYHALRMHLIQDVVLDNVLREELVKVEGRFNDRYFIRWNHKEIDGATLRKQVALFERLGYRYLCGKVYSRTGKVLNNEWLKEFVLTALYAAYPRDLADNTFKYMILSDEDDARITAHDFVITDEDKAELMLCHNLEGVLDDMYAAAYIYSAREF